MDNSVIIPPELYSYLWLLYALAAILLVALYYGVALLVTRPKKEKVVKPPTLTQKERIKSNASKEADRIQSLLTEGTITERELNQRLGVMLRAFAAEYSGIPTASMTLTELQGAGMPPELVGAVAQFYPTAFRANSGPTNPDQSVALAKQVINQWI